MYFNTWRCPRSSAVRDRHQSRWVRGDEDGDGVSRRRQRVGHVGADVELGSVVQAAAESRAVAFHDVVVDVYSNRASGEDGAEHKVSSDATRGRTRRAHVAERGEQHARARRRRGVPEHA